MRNLIKARERHSPWVISHVAYDIRECVQEPGIELFNHDLPSLGV